MKKHNKFMLKRVGKAINQFEMVEANDKVLIGLSGGKDSLVMLDILAKRRKVIPISYGLHAIHVDVVNVPYESDIGYLKKFCEDRGVGFNSVEIKVDFNKKPNKKPCFLCAWERRKVLFDYARKQGFNKVALGHNMDDALETLLMNMLNHANISSLPAKLTMFDSSLELIRPLIYLYNSDTGKYAKNNAFNLQKHTCPYEDKTQREKAAKILEILTAENIKAKENLFNAMGNIDIDYLPRIIGLEKLL